MVPAGEPGSSLLALDIVRAGAAGRCHRSSAIAVPRLTRRMISSGAGGPLTQKPEAVKPRLRSQGGRTGPFLDETFTCAVDSAE